MSDDWTVIDSRREKNDVSASLLLTLTFFGKLQVISLEGWTDIMYYVQDAHSFWDWVYFVLLIVVGLTICFLRIC